MSISRRSALKQIVVIAGGVTLIPSCLQKDQSTTSVPLRHLKLSGAQEKLLSELSETIIPATDTPGAKDLYLHQFALTMLDDCHSPEDQRAFEQGIKAFEKFTDKEMNGSFATLSPQQRTALLQRMEAQKDVPEDVAKFYEKAKSLTIQGYLTSKHYQTKVQVYELVPGRYKGCVPVGSQQQGAKPV